jgi:hypothetical protein
MQLSGSEKDGGFKETYEASFKVSVPTGRILRHCASKPEHGTDDAAGGCRSQLEGGEGLIAAEKERC